MSKDGVQPPLILRILRIPMNELGITHPDLLLSEHPSEMIFLQTKRIK